MKQGTSHIMLSLIAALLVPAGAAVAASPTSPAGRWLAEDIRGGGVIDRLQSVLEIAGDGRISGTGGCNRIMGKARMRAPRSPSVRSPPPAWPARPR